MAAKSTKSLELHYTTIQFLITNDIPLVMSPSFQKLSCANTIKDSIWKFQG